MLRHSEQSTETSRVYNAVTPEPLAASPYTAEEIAQAIAEIEAEQRARRAPQSNAARIESILAQLNLDMSASEVATKVAHKRRVQSGQVKRRRIALIGMATVLSCLGLGGALWRLSIAPAPAPAIVTETRAVEAIHVAAVQDTEPARASPVRTVPTAR